MVQCLAVGTQTQRVSALNLDSGFSAWNWIIQPVGFLQIFLPTKRIVNVIKGLINVI